MRRPRGGPSLHRFIMREAVSTGGLKRLCKACGQWVSDEFRTRSLYCQDHRRRKRAALSHSQEGNTDG